MTLDLRLKPVWLVLSGLNIKRRRPYDEIFTILRRSEMTSESTRNNGGPVQRPCGNCRPSKLLILVLFMLYAMCQVQILVNRAGSHNVAHILREIQLADERITDVELSLIEVESKLDFVLADWSKKSAVHSRTKRQSRSASRLEILRLKRQLRHLERRYDNRMFDIYYALFGDTCSLMFPLKI